MNPDSTPRSTQPCIPPGLLNRVPALAGVRREVTAARWQVIWCDPIWHVISRSGEVITTNWYTALHLYQKLGQCDLLYGSKSPADNNGRE